MKKTLTILLFMILGLSVDAQWYYSSYNVSNINELNEEQLNLSMDKALKTISTGRTLTIGGGLILAVGAVIYSQGLNDIINDDYTNINSNVNKGMTGAYMMYGGAALVGAGIPIWIGGDRRKSDIEIALIKFKSVGATSINGVGLKIRF